MTAATFRRISPFAGHRPGFFIFVALKGISGANWLT